MTSREADFVVSQDKPDPSLHQALQAVLEEAVAGDRAVHGGVLRVGWPGFAWHAAAGFAEPERALPMLPDDQFQAASITKMMTATAFMTLVEDGVVDLESGISRYLPRSVTSGLHDLDGRSYGPDMTPRQLLAHTSGVADYFGDGVAGPDGALPFLATMRQDPYRLWDPLELIAWTKNNLVPAFPPGQGWHYADTGYVLIGLIMEAVTGEPFHRVLRERLFEPLGMAHTYMLFREPARASVPDRQPTRAFAGASEYGATRSVSADWGGGGLVTTAHDLELFIRAFADDRVFRDRATRRQMLAWTPTGEPGVYYGLGVRRFVLDELGWPGLGEVWGHTGFLKSFMLYWPRRDVTICGTLNQSAATGAFSALRPVAALVSAVLGAFGDHVFDGGRKVPRPGA